MATSPRPSYKSIRGLDFGLGALGEFATKIGQTVTRITSPIVTATAVITAEVSDARTITITLKDRRGVAVPEISHCHIEVFTTSAMLDWSAGGSTGLAQGTKGKLLALVAKKVFRAISDVTGQIEVTQTDTATTACHLGLRLPNGNMVYIGNVTMA